MEHQEVNQNQNPEVKTPKKRGRKTGSKFVFMEKRFHKYQNVRIPKDRYIELIKTECLLKSILDKHPDVIQPDMLTDRDLIQYLIYPNTVQWENTDY